MRCLFQLYRSNKEFLPYLLNQGIPTDRIPFVLIGQEFLILIRAVQLNLDQTPLEYMGSCFPEKKLEIEVLDAISSCASLYGPSSFGHALSTLKASINDTMCCVAGVEK